MTKGWMVPAALAAALLAGAPALAGDGAQQGAGPAVVNADVGVPVFPYDLTDKPYTIVKPVKAGVRKATIFSKEASQEKIYRELWERAEKAGADAVVNATYGDSKISAFSWGKTDAMGIAVRFLTAEEIAAGRQGERAPAATEFTKEMFK